MPCARKVGKFGVVGRVYLPPYLQNQGIKICTSLPPSELRTHLFCDELPSPRYNTAPLPRGMTVHVYVESRALEAKNCTGVCPGESESSPSSTTKSLSESPTRSLNQKRCRQKAKPGFPTYVLSLKPKPMRKLQRKRRSGFLEITCRFRTTKARTTGTERRRLRGRGHGKKATEC